MSDLSVTRKWRCYVCGSTDIRKYNAVQHDGRYVCIKEHLLHEDALARIADLSAELAALKAENERLKCCGNCQYRRTGISGERCSISGWLVVPHANCQLTPSQWETRP